ncbi:MAG TPA: hypothetical protein V6C58_28300 [Allocoleopsis sp.]|jgi:hypothetical protein
MKVEFPIVMDGRQIMVTDEVESAQELFEFLAEMQELFSDTTCTRNGSESDHVKIRVRVDEDDNKYYEFYCYKGDKSVMGSKKAFGVNKKGGGLFPRNKDKEGNYLPNNGWVKFNKETGKEE